MLYATGQPNNVYCCLHSVSSQVCLHSFQFLYSRFSCSSHSSQASLIATFTHNACAGCIKMSIVACRVAMLYMWYVIVLYILYSFYMNIYTRNVQLVSVGLDKAHSNKMSESSINTTIYPNCGLTFSLHA